MNETITIPAENVIVPEETPEERRARIKQFRSFQIQINTILKRALRSKIARKAQRKARKVTKQHPNHGHMH